MGQGGENRHFTLSEEGRRFHTPSLFCCGEMQNAVRLNASEICAMRPNGVRYGTDNSVEDGISALC